jgi:hypothetical protein
VLGLDLQCLRAEHCSNGFSAGHSPGGFHCRQVLTQQARLWPSSPNVFEPEWQSCHQRQRQRGPQNLPAAFSL